MNVAIPSFGIGVAGMGVGIPPDHTATIAALTERVKALEAFIYQELSASLPKAANPEISLACWYDTYKREKEKQRQIALLTDQASMYGYKLVKETAKK